MGRGYSSNYRIGILNYDGVINKSDLGLHLGYDELYVDVPKELFAKEPPEWEKRWVNFWFETKAVDECKYKKRRIVAYIPFLQPMCVLFWLITKMIWRYLVALICLLVGRGINLKPLVRPWAEDCEDLYKYPDTKFFVEKKPLFWPLIPGVSVFFLITGYLLWKFDIEHFAWLTWFYADWYMLLVGIIIVIAILFALEFFVVGFVYFFSRLIDYFADKAKKAKSQPTMTEETLKAEQKRKKGQEKLKRKYQEFETLLACDGDQEKFKPTLEALPSSHRTIYLRFKDLKAKVCKPFAG
ncbi:MAG: hypothetical protein QMD50_00170 [Patescibacteria group bacterium]|nr:hypothetical protein [Patescibacteria group bacterium]